MVGRTQLPLPIQRPVLLHRYPPSRSTGTPTFWLACTAGTVAPAPAADALAFAPAAPWLPSGTLKPTLLGGGGIDAASEANLTLLLGGACPPAPSSTCRLFDAGASITHSELSGRVAAICNASPAAAARSTPQNPQRSVRGGAPVWSADMPPHRVGRDSGASTEGPLERLRGVLLEQVGLNRALTALERLTR